jgi:hypothetical protein
MLVWTLVVGGAVGSAWLVPHGHGNVPALLCLQGGEAAVNFCMRWLAILHDSRPKLRQKRGQAIIILSKHRSSLSI